MADALLRLLGGEHLGLAAEGGLVLGVVHLHVPGGHHQDGPLLQLEAQALGDAARLHPGGLGRQLHRGGGGLKLPHPVRRAELGQVLLYHFN